MELRSLSRCSTDSRRAMGRMAATAVALASFGLSVSARGAWQAALASPAGGPTTVAQRPPQLQLQGQLKETFTIGGCEYLSGMTCKVKYSGAHPLPSRVYFVE